MRYSKFTSKLIGAISILAFVSPTLAADGPTSDQIRYDNAAMCSAYMNLAVDYAKSNAEPAQEEAVASITAAAKDYHDFAISSGATLGDNEAAVDAKIATASTKLQKDAEGLTDAAFGEADKHLFEHCIGVGAGKPNEFVPYHPAWEGSVND